MSVCLSFEDVLGLLTYCVPDICAADLDDDEVLRSALQYGLIDTDLTTMECYGQAARRALEGRGLPSDPPQAFLDRLATAITRLFGLAPTSAPVGGVAK